MLRIPQNDKLAVISVIFFSMASLGERSRNSAVSFWEMLVFGLRRIPLPLPGSIGIVGIAENLEIIHGAQ